MPGTRSLKQTDSFNSSGATIMPEVVSRTDPRTHGSRSGSGSGSGSGFGGNSLRMLSSQDSVSREFDAALGAGDDGMIRLLQGQSNSGQWDFKSDFLRELNLPSDSPHLDIPADGSFHFDPTMLSADPAARSISDDVAYPQPTTSPTNFQNLKLETSASPFAPSPSLVPEFRPASATSFHSNHSVLSVHSVHSQSHSQSVHSYHSRGGAHRDSISGSEYSCSTTDVSEDQDVPMTSVTGTGLGQGDALTELNLAGMELGEGATMQWAAYEAVRRQVDGVSPAVIGLGHAGVNGQGQGQGQVQAPGQGGRLGPIRGVGGVGGGGEDDKKRFDRLEHRRSINRKSAQKHRARRKEELETLTQTIAERDSRIAFLEKELAVEKAKFQQMVGFIKDHTVIGARFAQSQAAQAAQGQGQAQAQAQAQGQSGAGVSDIGSAAQGGAAVGREGKRRSARLGDPGP